MTFIKYEERNFNDKTKQLVLKANTIIEEYQRKGYSLTLRQLYYQFVARGWLENRKENYNALGDAVGKGRMSGLISWKAIEDRTRNLQGINTVDGPGEALRRALSGYALDLWHNQKYRPEVWVEKEALVGVISQICSKLRVDFFACRGYNSMSEQWVAGQRFHNYVMKGQIPIIFHLGDHDPSGIDMTRDNRDRLAVFAGVPVTVVRLALNMDQIAKYNPPPNYAKITDPRAGDYIEKYGDNSWELDALSPEVISDLIETNVSRLRDEAKWSEALLEEVEDKQRIEDIIQELEDEHE